MTSLSLGTPAEPSRPEPRILWFWAAVALWITYALVFAGTEGASLGRAFRDGAANVIPLVGLTIACRLLLPHVIPGRPLPIQATLHTLGALGFSAAWYLGVIVLLASGRWISGLSFDLILFAGPALTWQMLQGAILYCAVAALILRPQYRSVPGELRMGKGLRRYLIRDGEDFRPVDVAEIVTIRGAEDYAEVATNKSRHLVRMSLAEFEVRLDPEQFIRVHRSAIVQLAHLERLEPAGSGRMLAHMRNGEIVAVSRTGAQALRQFVV